MDSYPIFTEDGFTFYFDISEGLRYIVSFHDSRYLLGPLLQRLAIHNIDFNFKLDDNISYADFVSNEIKIKRRNTICKIVSTFLFEMKTSIGFICDSEDNREMERARLFRLWHRRDKSKKNLIQKIIIDDTTEKEYYVGVIAYNQIHRILLLSQLNNPYLISIKD